VRAAVRKNQIDAFGSDEVSGKPLPFKEPIMIKRIVCVSLFATLLSLGGCVVYPYHHHDHGWRGWGHPHYYDHGYYRR
jgi:hypothetical protein